MNIDISNKECLVRTNDFGSSTIHNICDGTQQVVQWGQIDWLGTGVLFGLFLFMAALMIAVIAALYKDFLR